MNEDKMFIAFRSPLLDDQSICVERMSHIYDREQINKLTKMDDNQNLICCSIFRDNATLSYLINGLSTSTSHQNLVSIEIIRTDKFQKISPTLGHVLSRFAGSL